MTAPLGQSGFAPVTALALAEFLVQTVRQFGLDAEVRFSHDGADVEWDFVRPALVVTETGGEQGIDVLELAALAMTGVAGYGRDAPVEFANRDPVRWVDITRGPTGDVEIRRAR